MSYFSSFTSTCDAPVLGENHHNPHDLALSIDDFADSTKFTTNYLVMQSASTEVGQF